MEHGSEGHLKHVQRPLLLLYQKWSAPAGGQEPRRHQATLDTHCPDMSVEEHADHVAPRYFLYLPLKIYLKHV